MNHCPIERWLVALTAVTWVPGSFAQQPRQTAGQTHHFKPTQYYRTFSHEHPPALRIKPGDRVVTKTIDSGGRDETGTRVSGEGNPQTGPFYVEGAEPGDVLVVRLERIRPNRKDAVSSKVLAPYTVDPFFLRDEYRRAQNLAETWQIDLEKGVARPTSAEMQPFGIEVPLRPMLGCVGVAPRGKESFNTGTPGTFGGNMDYNGMTEGTTLMLPVAEPGALLFVGDGHAAQGHGEVAGNGLETSMDVEFSVDLIKNKRIRWPRLEKDGYIMVLGSARPLLQALQQATTELLRWMTTDYGYDERAATLLMGNLMEYEIANVVDPNFTVVAKMKKQYLTKTKQ
jgi:acetamidase/formamidase